MKIWRSSVTRGLGEPRDDPHSCSCGSGYKTHFISFALVNASCVSIIVGTLDEDHLVVDHLERQSHCMNQEAMSFELPGVCLVTGAASGMLCSPSSESKLNSEKESGAGQLSL